MKFISLFAGVGGFDLALDRLGHECVYANEWDKYCKQIYDKNFCDSSNRETDGRSEENKKRNDEKGQRLESEKGQGINNSESLYGEHSNSYPGSRTIGIDCRSITEVRTEEIPDHELLVGGFPCQSFSIAGKRGGFEDTRGTMFFEIARILRAKQPRLFILENVKGLLSHDNGRTFKTIIATLTELGYDLQWQVLNSKNFGVPQNRERVFIVGHLRGTPIPKVFPFTGEDNTYSTEQKSTEAAVARTLTGGGHSGGNHSGMTMIGTWRTHYSGRGFREMKSGLSPTIPARQREDASGQPVIAKTVSSGGRGSPHGSKQNWDSYEVYDTIRRLTPIECERLQGFPDNWTQGVSDTQRYKMMGNAVTVNVVYAIAKCL